MANISRSRKSGFVLRGGSFRRETLWFVGLETRSTIATLSTALLIGSLNAAALALRPFTVIRTRGIWRLKSDQVAATEDQVAMLGHAVVSDQASAIGVTAVSTPSTDSNSDLFFQYNVLFNDFQLGSAVGAMQQGTNQEIDSKAMRKVEEGEDMVITLETGSLSAGVIVSTFTRELIKLH